MRLRRDANRQFMTHPITRTVWTLSLVSLFTDVASEMLYPVMPIYLQAIGFSVLYIGILEGIAEATAGLSKGYFGRLSDVTGRRVPFVRAGYLLSAVAKPLVIAAANPIWVFLCRTADRLGKGVRTGARDALLSAEATAANKGTIFGFHRAMDTTGAAIGPALALGYLAFYPQRYHHLFLIAIVPGAIAVALTLLLKDKPVESVTKYTFSPLDFLRYWQQSSRAYRMAVTGMLLFTLFNSSDVFLLLLLKQRGFSDQQAIGVYIFYNLVYAIFSYPMGRLGDALGLRRTFIGGLFVFSLVYAGAALTTDFTTYLVLFFFYGIYAAMTEGISKAWISNLCKAEDTATAIGTLTAFSSIATLIASLIAAIVWQLTTPSTTFFVAASGGVLSLLYFLFVPTPISSESAQ